MEEQFYKGFSSLVIHAGHQKESTNAHVTPVYASSSYVFDNAEQGMKRFSGEEEGYMYARFGHPGAREAEEKIAMLEGFKIGDEGKNLPLKAILHSSGMAAISTLMFMNLKKGDKVLTHFSLYGGSDELLQNVLPHFGVGVVMADLNNPETAEEIIKKDASIRMIYAETPANPTLRCVDLQTLGSIANIRGRLGTQLSYQLLYRHAADEVRAVDFFFLAIDADLKRGHRAGLPENLLDARFHL